MSVMEEVITFPNADVLPPRMLETDITAGRTVGKRSSIDSESKQLTGYRDRSWQEQLRDSTLTRGNWLHGPVVQQDDLERCAAFCFLQAAIPWSA